MRLIQYILFFLLCIYYYSCTASDYEKTSDITFEELREKVNANSEKLYSLDADGEISIDSPELSNTGSITVSIIKPDSIYTKIEGPFGIDIADLLISRNDFIYYNANDNKVISGSSTPRNLKIIMKVNVSFDEIINAFSGKFTFKNDKYDEVKITMDNNNYIVFIKSGKETRKYVIDNQNFYVRKIGTYDNEGNTLIEINYENFYFKDDIYFPKKISIIRPKEKQYIWLTYFNEEFNNNKMTYKLKIPKNAKRIKW
ncbi:MAG: hypothetical protein HGGPFJEG_01768 [Ignavibacteria bacterium]|nr:hypothetical protein [Ignavibacteria bacterium]